MPADAPLPSARPLQRIASVHDGDTCHVLDDDDREVRVRLHGIDAPEMGQPFGRVARDRLRALIDGKAVAVEYRGQDRYGRPLVGLEIDGDDVGLRMVAEGLAWHFTRYSDDAGLAAAEIEARAARRGLWADPEPVAPWGMTGDRKGPQGCPTLAGGALIAPDQSERFKVTPPPLAHISDAVDAAFGRHASSVVR